MTPRVGDIVRLVNEIPIPSLYKSMGVVKAVENWADGHNHNWLVVTFPMQGTYYFYSSSCEVVGHVE